MLLLYNDCQIQNIIMHRSNSNEVIDSNKSSSKNYLSSKLKFNLLGAILFDYLSKLNEFNRLESSARKNRLHLDDEQLKKLNSIFSNLPFNILKQEYEKHSYEVKLILKAIICCSRLDLNLKSIKKGVFIDTCFKS